MNTKPFVGRKCEVTNPGFIEIACAWHTHQFDLDASLVVPPRLDRDQAAVIREGRPKNLPVIQEYSHSCLRKSAE